jgi:hypothetical protein
LPVLRPVSGAPGVVFKGFSLDVEGMSQPATTLCELEGPRAPPRSPSAGLSYVLSDRTSNHPTPSKRV